MVIFVNFQNKSSVTNNIKNIIAEKYPNFYTHNYSFLSPIKSLIDTVGFHEEANYGGDITCITEQEDWELIKEMSTLKTFKKKIQEGFHRNLEDNKLCVPIGSSSKIMSNIIMIDDISSYEDCATVVQQLHSYLTRNSMVFKGKHTFILGEKDDELKDKLKTLGEVIYEKEAIKYISDKAKQDIII